MNFIIVQVSLVSSKCFNSILLKSTINTKMFDFLNLRWVLSFAFCISKVFGNLFISINFSSLKTLSMSRKYSDYCWFIVSLGFSLYSLSHYDYLAIEEMTRSKVMEIGVNAMNRMLVLTSCALKITSMINGRVYFEILCSIRWCHEKVMVV